MFFGGVAGADLITPISDVEYLNAKADTVTDLTTVPLKAARYGHTASTLKDGSILLIGGATAGGVSSAPTLTPLRSGEIYFPSPTLFP